MAATHLTRDDYVRHILPYRMKAVDAFNLALRYLMKWDSPRPMKIYFDDKLAIQGTSAAYTNPVVEAGIIHCRALLEFVGLKAHPKRPDKLIERTGRRETDLVIEDFSGPSGPLRRVTVAEAVSSYAGPAEEGEKSLATIIRAANRGVGHTTVGHLVETDRFSHFEIASRGVPVLVANAFYVKLGLKPPDYKIASVKREDV